MTVFEILALRSEYEDIVLNFKVPGIKKPGTLENLQWFVNNGSINKKKPEFERAMEIATLIVQHETGRKKRK